MTHLHKTHPTPLLVPAQPEQSSTRIEHTCMSQALVRMHHVNACPCSPCVCVCVLLPSALGQASAVSAHAADGADGANPSVLAHCPVLALFYSRFCVVDAPLHLRRERYATGQPLSFEPLLECWARSGSGSGANSGGDG